MSRAIKVTSDQMNSMLEYYANFLQYQENSHIIARARTENAVITFYSTNTVLFQGISELTEYSYWAEKWGLKTTKANEEAKSLYENLSVIGSDEVGTGDYFGPIVVCSTFVSKEQIPQLKQLGVKDSKLLTDEAINEIAYKIKDLITYSLLVLSPEKINSLNQTNQDNFNFIKAFLHNCAINSILKKLHNVKYDAIIIDEFTPKEKYFQYLNNHPQVEKNITMVPHGEKGHVAVAAASVLARAAFLQELKKMSQQWQVELLKGASNMVDKQAIALVKKYGFKTLSKVAKMKFANTERVYDYFNSHKSSVNE